MNQNVIIDDITNPVIVLEEGTVVIEVHSAYNEPGYTATDDKDGDITGNVVVNGTVDTEVVGEYTLTYTVSDNAGHGALHCITY